MAAAAGFMGSAIGRSITLWHLGRSLYDDGQAGGAQEVLERAAEALDTAMHERTSARKGKLASM
eukprot:CAMPEP_0177788274 /NCGR_PEP_ID=MMETSP0491_2-20121128/22014_1 /TAXON_ID=63592 /ORGANISM="Tetraselmis chuii, Strain PLY429" /LENGTH=63 /DNA_ID=CAMNT_0019309831 /DNA_START=1 /DNA_END=189 /DNA_ORIENTATION=+